MPSLWLHVKGASRRPAYVAFAVVMLVLLGACAQMPRPAGHAIGDTPKNIIILFGDGAAATQWELGRYTNRVLRNRSYAVTDVVFKNGSIGLMSTYSADSPVTDSAAAATAMSSGNKTNNDMVGVKPDGVHVRTLMEVAKAKGRRIGLVSTAKIYDASPAAFSVHARSRREAQGIVDQLLALEPDVLMGGGRDYFLPKNKLGGRRSDGVDVVQKFAAKGYDISASTGDLRSASVARLLALFADGDMEFEIDRDPKQEPSVAEMAAAAIRVLSANSANGFVLFLENENIDSAGHNNDIAALIRELWAFEEALNVALEFQRNKPGETLIIVTGDHETGGLSVTSALKRLAPYSNDNYFYPNKSHLDLIAGIKMSLGKAADLLGDKPTSTALDKILAQSFPGFTLEADLRSAILERRVLERNITYITEGALGRMVARQTGFYWGTTSHTTEPAVVGAIGPGQELFRGYMDNTDFAKALHKLIDGR
jgi:alkaline phosphatase